MVLWVVAGLVLIWLVFTSMHSISPGERGVVSRFGRYSSTLGPGVSFTLPSPIDRVKKIDVENIRTIDIGSDDSSDLMLTGDQNLIDIAYTVRWNIRTPELYLFQLAQPDETIREVAESAMRSVVSRVTLNDAMGDRRAEIESQVAENMQRILDSYRSGIQVQGIAIKQADPPAAVNDAFKEVTAAQQDAKSYINSANAYSLQLGQKAQGDATAFDKVYEQYKLAPEVTRRRMYYETMEQVLSKVDKTIVETPGVVPYLPLPQVQKSPAAAARRSRSSDRLPAPPAVVVGDRRGSSSASCSAASRSSRRPSRRSSSASASRCGAQPLQARAADRRGRAPASPGAFRSSTSWCGSTSASRMSTCSASRCCRPTSAGSRSTRSRATGLSIRC